MLWIGAQFGVCRCLESKDESLSLLNLVGTFKEQKKGKETFLVAESAYKTQKSQFSRVVEIKVGARNQ